MSNTLYDFSVKAADGSLVPMSVYKGKILLIVNVASECGFTNQYEGLEKLYAEFNPQGFEVLGFPCNQFGGQEPGTNEQIQDFCRTHFGVQFKVFAKVDVNGDSADPLFVFLKEKAKGILGTQAIKWNFTKFLVDGNGQVLQRFSPQETPENIRTEIVKLLEKGKT